MEKWKLPLIFGILASLAILWDRYQKFNDTTGLDSELGSSIQAGEFELVRIIDGDSIVVDKGQGQIKVRLLGIDCPERNQAYGAEATNTLKETLGSHRLRVKGQKKDRWGRLLAHVYVGENLVNLELVKKGCAWVYRAEQDIFWADLNDAEEKARGEGLGLWSLPNPIYPGEWRKRK